MSSLTLLGTGTCQIEFERRASSVLLELDETYILFDCGHGVVQRLLERGIRHYQVEHVILSHFHPDHVSDLIPFLHAGAYSQRDPRSKDVHIYGPVGVQRLVDGLMNIYGLDFSQLSFQVHTHEIAAGPFTVSGHPFEFVSLPPAGNHGIRFSHGNKTYALTGDSHFHNEEIVFLQAADLAVIDSGHLTDAEIVALASISQTNVIVCSHLYRELNAQDLQKRAEERGYNGTILVGYDLLSFLL